MTLFSEMHRTDIGPPTYGEPHYSYLDQSARPEAARVRAVLEASFAQYPREERTAFLSAFRSSNDAQFLAAAFELYLHEVLRRLGYQVKVHPKNPTGKSSRPDFLVIHPDNSPVYIEAVLATDVPDNQRAVQARKNTVYDVLNGLGPTDFYLGMEMESAPETPPPARKLKNELQRWLSQLDADSISRAIEANGRSSFPRHNFEHDGWRIEFFAVPKSREKRGQPDIRPKAYAVGSGAISIL